MLNFSCYQYDLLVILLSYNSHFSILVLETLHPFYQFYRCIFTQNPKIFSIIRFNNAWNFLLYVSGYLIFIFFLLDNIWIILDWPKYLFNILLDIHLTLKISFWWRQIESGAFTDRKLWILLLGGDYVRLINNRWWCIFAHEFLLDFIMILE